MKTRDLYVAAACLALNLSLGKIASALSLPVYLDSIGTILAAALLSWRLAACVGVASALLAGIVINPFYPPYAGTQLTIALVASGLRVLGAFRRAWTSLLGGFAIALSAMIVSAPVTVLLFGGVTQSGTTAINAVLIAAGVSVWKSVVGGSFLVESIDKPTAAFLAYLVLKRLPTRLAASRLPEPACIDSETARPKA